MINKEFRDLLKQFPDGAGVYFPQVGLQKVKGATLILDRLVDIDENGDEIREDFIVLHI